MDTKTYLKISAINLLFLLVGLLLGIILPTQIAAVHAQSKPVQGSDSLAARDAVSTRVTLDPNAEYITPAISLGGPVVTNTLLASKLACDRLQVNGFEPLRLNDAMMNTLVRKHYLTNEDVQAIVEAGKAEHPMRIKPQ